MDDVEREFALVGPSQLLGRPARAIAALSTSGGRTAIWLVNFAGERCGAWVLDTEDRDEILIALSIVDRRSILDLGDGQARSAFETLLQAGAITDPAGDGRFASITQGLAEIGKARADYEEALAASGRTTKSRPVPLTWATPLPESLTSEIDRAGQVWSGDGDVPGAFVVAVLAGRLVRLWIETESLRVRRKALRDTFGDAGTLPPSWTEAALHAYGASFRSLDGKGP